MANADLFLFCFGLGYSATALARRLRGEGWDVAGTSRPGRSAPGGDAIPLFPFARDRPLDGPGAAALARASHILISIPPDAVGDPVLDGCAEAIALTSRAVWIGYLSTTGVYGDTGGAPVDEASPLAPTSARSRWRAAAERAWLAFGGERNIAVQVFRLAGIYGPGRSPLDRLRAGQAQRIDRPGHRFGRIHVDDIATVLRASIARPRAGGVYNVADDEPAEPEKVIACAAALLGLPPPPLVPFAEAAKSMSPMALSFWQDNRLVVSRCIRDELGVQLAYPTYREGLQAILAAAG